MPRGSKIWQQNLQVERITSGNARGVNDLGALGLLQWLLCLEHSECGGKGQEGNAER